MPAVVKGASLTVAAVLALAACGKPPAPPAPPAPEVTVQTVDSQPVQLELTYPARTVGSREVEVRARVGGIVLKRRFQEGSRIKQGEPMFQIDPEPVRARLAAARAEVAVAKARLEEARRNRERVLPLFQKNAVSQSRRDEAVSAYDVAAANLLSAESQLRMAQLDLEYTDVRAPISGLTSREVLSEGSLVSTDQQSSLLTTIVQVDPLYIEFSVPEGEAALIRSGLAPANKSAPPPGVKLILEDGSEYPQPAQVTFVDNAVDRNSGTVRVRAVMPNEDAELIPGQFIRAKVEGIQLSNAVSVPRKAIMSGPQGSFVWLVGADSKAQMRPVQVGRTLGNNVIVTDGLKTGDRYIVEGVMKVMQPGIQVSAVSAEEAARQSRATAPKEAA
jgi:membrane fusion protein (multidrug efflux system)